LADLAAAWEEHAADFVAWARTPDHDSYWLFHRDQFLELLPPPGGRTLDLGCGEGRLACDLKELGHDVVTVDLCPTMVAAASCFADAADLPFDDACFDLVVAFMSLQDMDDMDGAIREAGRVLEPGGTFCIAVVHPLASAGRFAGEDASSPFVIEGSYLEAFRYSDSFARDGLEMTL
jgi:SAM-dependent methyltransferase